MLEAVDGENALQVISSYSGTIHMLLTDVIMPGISGRELARRVQRLRPDIKVLYSSGYTDDAIIHYGVLDTGTDFIQKPYSPVQLIQKIQEVFKRAS